MRERLKIRRSPDSWPMPLTDKDVDIVVSAGEALADRVAALETALRKIQDVYGTPDCTCIVCLTCRAALAGAAEPPETPVGCPYGDPGCPCPDGDVCHYVATDDTPAMKPPETPTTKEEA